MEIIEICILLIYLTADDLHFIIYNGMIVFLIHRHNRMSINILLRLYDLN